MPELPEDAIRLILEYADSVPHLEALQLISENAPCDWPAEQVAARIYLSIDAVRQVLRDLRHRGLLLESPEGAFRLTDDPRLRETVTRITQIYRAHISRVATLIHLRESPAVREFARAFRLKDAK